MIEIKSSRVFNLWRFTFLFKNQPKSAGREKAPDVNKEKKELTQAEKEALEAKIKPYQFRPYADLTDEEREIQRRIRSQGGKAAQAKRREQETLNEICKSLLNRQLDREQASEILGTAVDLLDDDELILGAVLTIKMCQEAAKGNVRAYETVRDTAGYAPKNLLAVTADIVTEADRNLMDNIKNRLALVQNDKTDVC